MISFLLRNMTGSPIEVDDLGITIHPDDDRDLLGRSDRAIAQSSELAALVQAGTVRVLQTDGTPYSTADGLTILKYGVLKENVGLGNVPNTLNNLAGNAIPGSTNDSTQGYSQGSLWVHGQRVYSCTNATTNAAQWYELTQPAYHPGVVTGRFYSSEMDAATTNGTLSANIIYAIPLNFPAGVTLNRIGVEVINATPSSAIRLGIYTNQSGQPGSLRLDAGAVSASTTGAKEIVINYTTENDWCWLVCTMNASVGVRCLNAPTGGGSIMGRTSTADTGTRRLQADWDYGFFPFTFPSPASYSVNNPPFIWVRKV